MQLAHFPFLSHSLHSFEVFKHEVRQQHFPTAAMFFLYVLPLSAIPPLMFNYAGTHYSDAFLSGLSEWALMTIGSVFFVAELVMTFILAAFIQWLGNATFRIMHTRYEMLSYPTPDKPDKGTLIQFRRVDFRDAYTLAAISPTPLWLASFALFIPNFVTVATFGAFGLILSLYILYAATPTVLKIDEKGEGILMGWVLLITGMIGWATMMYLTLLTWGYATGGQVA